jgi:hypothetical protein
VKYASSAAFRRALEDRLRVHTQKTALPLIRLRKLVAFERLLARLTLAQPTTWILKGGLALQLRLGSRARTTQDVDLLMRVDQRHVHETLVSAAARDLDDWFQFEIAQATMIVPDQIGTAYRFHTQALLDGRAFETFHVDVGLSDPVVEAVDKLVIPSLLAFADIPPTIVPCYPVTQHLAEKVHAYTLPRPRSENTRVKDLVDIVLLAGLNTLSADSLRQALWATFTTRNTHPLPDRWPDPPPAWALPFRRQAAEVNLKYATLDEADVAARQFIEPVLQGKEISQWNPQRWEWQTLS